MTTRRTMLALSAAALAVQWLAARQALALGTVEKGIHRVKGDVRVNGQSAKQGMDVKAGDVITTGRDGEVVFVAANDAFLVRANSRVEAQGTAGSLLLSGLRVVTGAVLSVFESGQRKTIHTPTATIGIRGTGIYIEVEPGRTYACTCYGEAELVAADDPPSREVVRTTHHEQPRYIMGKGAPQMLMGAPVINHTDAELILLEDIVARRPPFTQREGYRPGSY